MTKVDILFIRTDEKVEGSIVDENDYIDHIKYLTNISKNRYFIGGGSLNNPGGMVVFSAKDIEEAKIICDKDPLILRGLYMYKLMIWEVVIINKNIDIK